LKKASSGSLSDVAYAMIPEVHRFDHPAEEGRFDGTPFRGINEFDFHKVQIVGLFSLIDVLVRSVRILSDNGELPVVHVTTNFASYRRHSANRQKIDTCISMEAVLKFDGGGDAVQGETHKAVATGLGLKNAVIGSLHWPSRCSFVCPEDIMVLVLL